MKIVNKKIDEIKPYKKNPRNNNDAVDYVANSIKQFGFKVPIVIDKNGTIVTGHTRYKASKQLGLETVPTIIADDLTDEQVKAFRLADNKVSELATWDYDLLELELDDIGLDMTDFSFLDDDEEPTSFEDYEPTPVSNEEIEYTEPTRKHFNHVCPKCGFKFNEEGEE